MKRNIFHSKTILAAAALLAVCTGCSKESPFGPEKAGEGKLLKAALSMSLTTDDLVRPKAPARAEANIGDFNVIFTREGSSQPVAKYKYSEMPEVVTLQAGKYTCTATYGELRSAEWESPYFLGTSEQFEVVAYEITSYIEPIECRLENVKVTVDFDPSLRSAMSVDSFVEVKVGSSSALSFSLEHADSQTAGYFMHSGETTLVATFNGKINGVQTSETKSLRDIQKGCHYKITFKLHEDPGSNPTGDINGEITIDASVSIVDINCDVPLGEEPLLDDDERPKEGDDDDPPGPPAPPVITGEPPVDLDGVNNGNTMGSCVLNIHSSAEGGITAFTCDIESPSLTPEELQSVGLASHLDLVDTDPDLAGALSGLGFPVNVGGQKDVRFDITPFLSMLGVFGPYTHTFVLKVTDANGATQKNLIIQY